MIRAIIVDDEELARKELDFLLKETKEVEVIAELDSAEELFEVVERTKPDVVFLDIEMYGLSGLDAAFELLKMPQPPIIVFATAYDQYAVKAFELNALDYLLKPFSFERVKLCIERIKRALENRGLYTKKLLENLRIFTNKKVLIHTEDKILLLNKEEIYIAEAQGRYARIKLKNKWIASRHSLSDLEKILTEEFLKVHKSYIVNIEHIKEIIPFFGGSIILRMADDNATEVPVGRTFLKGFKEKFGLKI